MAAESEHRIKVAVRVRNLIGKEKDKNKSLNWKLSENKLWQVEPRTGNKIGQAYTFDYVFGMNSQSQDIFHDLVKPIVDSCVNGFNGTIFAYGQTASGKTYTMMGERNEDGIIPLSVSNIFKAIERSPEREFLIRVAYMEIYNEQIHDLLDIKNTNLKIHEDSCGQEYVTLKEEVADTPEKVIAVMKKGEKMRRIGGTDMNERSSRSHTIFRIMIESRKRQQNEDIDEFWDGAVKVSILNLVDLAGSERSMQTKTTGERFKEGCAINKSLFYLGNVISRLSEGSGQFVNFRDSKLTRILRSSLGGNAHTAIICTITPASIEETISTLNFASRAIQVKNEPHVNEVISDECLMRGHAALIKKLVIELEKAKKENECASMKKELEQKEKLISKLEDWIKRDKKHIASPMKDPRSERRKTWAASDLAYSIRRNQFSVEASFPEESLENDFSSEVYSPSTRDVFYDGEEKVEPSFNNINFSRGRSGPKYSGGDNYQLSHYSRTKNAYSDSDYKWSLDETEKERRNFESTDMLNEDVEQCRKNLCKSIIKLKGEDTNFHSSNLLELANLLASLIANQQPSVDGLMENSEKILSLESQLQKSKYELDALTNKKNELESMLKIEQEKSRKIDNQLEDPNLEPISIQVDSVSEENKTSKSFEIDFECSNKDGEENKSVVAKSQTVEDTFHFENSHCQEKKSEEESIQQRADTDWAKEKEECKAELDNAKHILYMELQNTKDKLSSLIEEHSKCSMNESKLNQTNNELSLQLKEFQDKLDNGKSDSKILEIGLEKLKEELSNAEKQNTDLISLLDSKNKEFLDFRNRLENELSSQASELNKKTQIISQLQSTLEKVLHEKETESLELKNAQDELSSLIDEHCKCFENESKLIESNNELSLQVKELQEKLNTARKDVDLLETELEMRKNQVSDAEKRNLELSTLFDSKTREFQELQSVSNLMKEELSSKEYKLNEGKQRVSQLESILEKLRGESEGESFELKVTKSELASVKEEFERQVESFNDLTIQMKDLQDELHTARKSVDLLEAEMKMKDKKIVDGEKQNLEFSSLLDKKTSELQRYELDMKIMEEDLSSKVQELNLQKQAISDLQSIIIKFRSETEIESIELKTVKDELVLLMEERSKYVENESKLIASNEELSTQVKELHNKLNSTTQEMDLLEVKLKTVKDELLLLMEERKKYVENESKLIASNEELSTQVKELHNKLNSTTQEMDLLEVKLKTVKDELLLLMEERKKYVENESKLVESNEELSTQVKELHNKLNSTTQEMDLLEVELKTVKEELFSVREERSKYIENEAKLITSNEELTTQVKGLHDELNSNIKEMDLLEVELEVRNNKICETQKQIMELSGLLGIKNNQIQGLEITLNKMEKEVSSTNCKLNEQTQIISQLQSKFEKSVAKTEEESFELKSIQDEFASLMEEHRKCIENESKLTESNNQLLIQVKELQEKLNTSKNDKIILEEELEKIKNCKLNEQTQIISQLQSKFEKSVAKTEEESFELKSIQDEFASLMEEHRKCIENESKLTESNNQLLIQVKELQEKLNTSKNDKIILEEELEKIKNRICNPENSVVYNVENCPEISLDKLNKELSARVCELNEKTKLISQLQSALEEAENKIRISSSELIETRTEFVSLLDDYRKCIEKESILANLNDELSTKINEIKVILSSSEAKIAVLENELVIKRDDINAIEKRNLELSSQLEQKETTVKEMEHYLNNVKDELRAKINELQEKSQINSQLVITLEEATNKNEAMVERSKKEKCVRETELLASIEELKAQLEKEALKVARGEEKKILEEPVAREKRVDVINQDSRNEDLKQLWTAIEEKENLLKESAQKLVEQEKYCKSIEECYKAEKIKAEEKEERLLNEIAMLQRKTESLSQSRSSKCYVENLEKELACERKRKQEMENKMQSALIEVKQYSSQIEDHKKELRRCQHIILSDVTRYESVKSAKLVECGVQTTPEPSVVVHDIRPGGSGVVQYYKIDLLEQKVKKLENDKEFLKKLCRKRHDQREEMKLQLQALTKGRYPMKESEEKENVDVNTNTK